MLEGYGGAGESSTDDDILASAAGKHLRSARGCVVDSCSNSRFSLMSQAGSLSSFSRQVLSHLRSLQANLGYLKVICVPVNVIHAAAVVVSHHFLLQEVELKYNNLISQRPERSAAETEGSKGTAASACELQRRLLCPFSEAPSLFPDKR